MANAACLLCGTCYVITSIILLLVTFSVSAAAFYAFYYYDEHIHNVFSTYQALFFICAVMSLVALILVICSSCCNNKASHIVISTIMFIFAIFHFYTGYESKNIAPILKSDYYLIYDYFNESFDRGYHCNSSTSCYSLFSQFTERLSPAFLAVCMVMGIMIGLVGGMALCFSSTTDNEASYEIRDISLNQEYKA